MSEFSIKDIDFGKTDGKVEASKSNFRELFFDNQSHYKKLRDENCFIIYGYKGTGKTLLANFFAKNKESRGEIKKLYSNDFIQEKLLSFSKKGINKEELIIFWKYVYLREVASLILDKADRKKIKYFIKRKTKKLRGLLKEVQMIVDKTETFTELVDSASSEVKTSMKEYVNAGYEINKSLKDSVKSKNIRANYIDLIRDLEEEVFNNIKSKDEYYLIYDDMDQLEESLEREEFINLMKQMIYAADNFNDKMRQKNIECRVIHVMRSDILELLTEDSSNLIKTVTDFGVEIDWYAKKNKNPESHPLMKMIIHKIRSSVSEFKDLSDKNIYDNVFDRDSPILGFILERSFGRPREAIRFLSIVQEMYPEENKITIEMLRNCMPDYSKWFYESMVSEIKVNKFSKEIKEIISFIRRRGYKKFTHKKLITYLNQNPGQTLPNNSLEVLQEMYKLGIIIIINTNGTAELYYRKNAPILANEATKFVVHYGFINYLNLK